jgi:flagellar biosynthesis/type III secretory pathway protein FliH
MLNVWLCSWMTAVTTSAVLCHNPLQAFNEGLNAGFNQGRDAGYVEGANTGFQDGVSRGFNDGKGAGFREGLNAGFQVHESTDTYCTYGGQTLC